MKFRYSLVFSVFIIINLVVLSISIMMFSNGFNNTENPEAASLAVKANEIAVFAEQNFSNIRSIKVSYDLRNMLDKSNLGLKILGLDGSILFDDKNSQPSKEKAILNEILSNTNKENNIILTINVGEQVKALAVFNAVKGNNTNSSLLKIGLFYMITAFISFILLSTLLFAYFNKRILKPFRKLEKFSQEIARGNFDIPLPMEKTNIFGAFTWAFDMMRTELKKAKESELEAQKAKKELIATLSHDIKTPVASIKAYAEGLIYNMDNSSERREKYLHTIMKKSDEVTGLVNDLFVHAITDLEKLEIKPSECYSRELIESILEPYEIQLGDRFVINHNIPNIMVWTDSRRLSQVIDNIISNSLKYAPQCNIEVSAQSSDGYFVISIKDNGKGINPEDLPFIFEKFFRGKNTGASEVQGSGLGLYISKYIMDKTEGFISIHNIPDNGGLCVIVGIKTV